MTSDGRVHHSPVVSHPAFAQGDVLPLGLSGLDLALEVSQRGFVFCNYQDSRGVLIQPVDYTRSCFIPYPRNPGKIA